MRVFIRSFGCSTNVADGEVLAGCLAHAGNELVSTASLADIVIYNTCAVKGPTENRIVEALKRIPKSKKLVVTGCLPSVNLGRLVRDVRFDGIAGPAAGERIVNVVASVSRGEKIDILKQHVQRLPDLTLPRVRSSSVVSIVPISYGCLGSCTYCCVILARGRVQSYDVEDIVRKVKGDVDLGYREFWLTSQDVACYGRDKDTNLVELLKSLCAIKGDFKIRVGMMTPNMVIDMYEDLEEIFEEEHIFKFLHLPVQSGDDQVLESMGRFYSTEDFRKIVQSFRFRFPALTFATDIICGFPGEDSEAFERTLRLVREIKPDILNVSKFFARPNTPAAEMNDSFIPFVEIKKRSGRAAELAKCIALENNEHWVGWSGTIRVNEKGKVPGSWVGRNFAYKPVAIKTEENILGGVLPVTVTRAYTTYLEGRIG